MVHLKDILSNILRKEDFFKPKPKRYSPQIKALTKEIIAHLESNRLRQAVRILFAEPEPFPSFIYARLFQHCSSKQAIIEARRVESHLASFWITPPIFLLNRAIETFGKCGVVKDAQQLFDEMPMKDGGTWNAMITAYSQNGYCEKALLKYSDMNKLGVSANEITFASVLGSCGVVLDIILAIQVHGLVVKYGFWWNIVVSSSLVNVYGKCGIMDDARRVFDEILYPNDVTWNVIVRRYLDVGDEREAVVLFFKMIGTEVRPLNFTFSNALTACSYKSAFNEGIQIHGVAVKVGFTEDKVVVNSLFNMYAKCGALVDARWLFDHVSSRDVMSWTSIVTAYATCGKTEEARNLFNDMPERTVVSWNAMLVGYTRFLQWEEALEFICWMRKETNDINNLTVGVILNVCAGLSDIVLGKQVHGFAYRHGFHSNRIVANALLDMYGKCGNLKYARVWFVEMGDLRDEVSWNALISHYARQRMSEEAISMFREMLWETTPSEFTFSTILAACANIFALEEGMQIHCYMLRNGYNLDVIVRGTLVDMYSKCRFLDYAIKIFKNPLSSDLILWNSIVLGCAHNGKGKVVLDLFELMQQEGIKSDHITFKGILLACIGEGYVDLGRKYFDIMSKEHCIIPRFEHYECMIELYGRYGYMDELEDFVHKMPFEPTESMLNRIFDACREHRHSILGEWTAQRLNDFQP
ncbi:Pentatricopeptide repeat-containing protein [Thalictrum thalictroides]|uniref:Pentatricopeptide repeat-containing protein n=1 Tax=Thalictrum thalictroides TaxID=46969 RepID=A0A7J6W7X9_THATH|nr:Pentatricopeptide repeat-containing protein [Thalictrum thalictroides]